MKVPVCDICRLTPVKCKLCEQRLDAGEITEADFTLSRALSKTKAKDVELIRSFDLKKYIVAKVNGKMGPEVDEALCRPVIAVNSGQEIIQKLKIPTRPSTVFVGGEEKTRLAISKAFIESEGIDATELARALAYFGMDSSIV